MYAHWLKDKCLKQRYITSLHVVSEFYLVCQFDNILPTGKCNVITNSPQYAKDYNWFQSRKSNKGHKNKVIKCLSQKVARNCHLFIFIKSETI